MSEQTPETVPEKKPAPGDIVIVHGRYGKPMPGIITAVHEDGRVDIFPFKAVPLANQRMRQVSGEEKEAGWSWPVRD